MTDDQDRVWRRNEPDSPCQAVCLIDRSTGFCLGCNRTANEIAAWSRMPPETRAAVKAELAGRRTSRGKRKGGRARRISDCKDSER